MKTPLRIGYNMWTYTTTEGGGMVYFALSLLREFCRAIPENLILFYGPHGRDLISTVKEISRIRCIELHRPTDIYQHRQLFDVLFTPGAWGGVNMLDYPTVHVIPDIQDRYYPEFFSKEELEFRDISFGHCVRASTFLITISNFSKKTIVEKFGVPDEHIQVTHLAAHPIFSDDSNTGRRPTTLPEGLDRFLFYPANSWKHKNHKGLLDGLLILRRDYNTEIPCVFTGHLLNGQFNNVDIIREIHDRGLEKLVYHIGGVTLAELKYLYLHAAGLVHPSLFEGFGIPLVEAMACGCPLIAADDTSIPEIAGKAALYFNPKDPADIADKIHHFINHPSEVQERVDIGRALSRNFSDTKTAEKALRILEKAQRTDGFSSLKAKTTATGITERPFLSMLLVLDKPPTKQLILGIDTLLKEFPNSVQVIAVIRQDIWDLAIELLPGQTKTVPLGEGPKEAILEATSGLQGEYVFLSDGKSAILPSFIYFLMVHDGNLREKGELLHGDWYLKALKGKGIADSSIFSANDEEGRKAHVCEHLSFVVRRQAFLRVARGESERLNTLSGIVSELWDQCSRTRLYKIVNLRLVRNVWLPGYIFIVTSKLKNQLAAKPWLKGLLRTKFGTRVLMMMVQVYYWVPVRLQRGILKVYKTLTAG